MLQMIHKNIKLYVKDDHIYMPNTRVKLFFSWLSFEKHTCWKKQMCKS